MADDGRTLLLIDDEPAQIRLVAAVAARLGWRTVPAATLGHAQALLARSAHGAVDAVLIDRDDAGAADAVAQLRAGRPNLPILVVVTPPALGHAIAAMRAGATDFLLKPLTPDRLLAALDAALDDGVAGELRSLAERLTPHTGFDGIIGDTPQFSTALGAAAKAARARVPVLIEGESGAGKELVAHAIHAASPRASRPMVAVNCGAIPANLIESELFGHERGAFTGAFDKRVGRFEEADGGTLFLDDVGEMPLDAQVKLLRVLQSGEIQPLGSRGSREVDVRVIAASRRRLVDHIAHGRFREDLYYRLAVVQVDLPPLRDRVSDIPALARWLLGRIGELPGMRRLSIDDGALALIGRYPWPGNVRQLAGALFRVALNCDDDRLTSADFPTVARLSHQPIARLPRASEAGAATTPVHGVALFDGHGHMRPLDQIEADVIRLAIVHYRGRMTEVARRLGIGRSTLYRKLGELGIDHAA